MRDGHHWTTINLGLEVSPSYCYDEAPANCRTYGRLYTWEAAVHACQNLGGGWHLPSHAEWEGLAAAYGGVDGESPDSGRFAYRLLVAGGGSAFDAQLGGGRDGVTGQYARLDAHGFYWTATATGEATAWFYNFGKGGLALHQHSDGEKGRAFSVRCLRS
jgi:uncharacterized protein (TIGR02145 family)